MTEAATTHRKRLYRDVPMHSGKGKGLSAPNMAVEVRDFGPISKGKIDLRPLTVFAGPSNTGKSWMATLIYVLGLLPCVGKEHVGGQISGRSKREDVLRKAFAESGLPQFPKDPQRLEQAIYDQATLRLTEKEAGLVRLAAQSSEEAIDVQLRRCYGLADSREAIRYGSRGTAKIDARVGEIGHNITIGRRRSGVSLGLEWKNPHLLDLSGNRNSKGQPELSFQGQRALFELERVVSASRNRNEFAAAWNIYACLDYIYNSGRRIRNTYLLPANRGGIMDAHAAMVRGLVQEISYFGIQGERTLPVLSGVVSDFLMRLLKMAELHRHRSASGERCDYGLVRNVLSGEVKVERTDIGYPQFTYTPDGWEHSIPLARASSMVKEVSPVALFLRYFVGYKDLLIIEEPEAHLYPALQRQVAREVVRLVSRGIRVLLTTHSDWIINELSIAVGRHEEAGLSCDEQSLSKEDVGIWLFPKQSENQPNVGTIVSEVRWDPEDGGYEPDYYDMIVGQSNDWARVANAGADRRRNAK